MITIKIGKQVKIQKYRLNGLRLFLKVNNKWYCIKLNESEVNLLEFIIKIIH